MKRIKMILVAMAAVIAVGAVGASAASAAKVDLTLSGTAAGQTIPKCDATVTVLSGGPPPAATVLDGSSFAGRSGGSFTPCDPTTLTINNNPTVTFSGAYNASINSISVTDAGSGCTFTTSSTALTGGTTVNGPYSGSDTAAGSGSFLCNFVTATIYVDNAVFS